jgi:hypothetical protein
MERFFNKINKTDTCWFWLGALRGKSGYGAIKIEGKVVDTHRFSYSLHYGEIPKGMLICHTCDNKTCVNPNHLFLGTFKDNFEDAKTKKRIFDIGVYQKSRIPKHPSSNAYKNGCRCNECRNIEKLRVRNYRMRKLLKKNTDKS